MVKELLQTEAMTQGRPSPKKTLTELDPVTFPTAESANFSAYAAAIEAKVSGREVPKATNVMAVTDGLIPKMQPNNVATSPTTAVTIPIAASAITKHNQPPHMWGGGTIEKNSFHPIVARCMKASIASISLISPSSSLVGCNIHAFINCYPQGISSEFSIFFNS